jgi:hypothetical protein
MTGPADPLSLSLGSWSRHLFYFCSSELSSLLARPLPWYLASVSSFAAALGLVVWVAGPGLASACDFARPLCVTASRLSPGI